MDAAVKRPNLNVFLRDSGFGSIDCDGPTYVGCQTIDDYSLFCDSGHDLYSAVEIGVISWTSPSSVIEATQIIATPASVSAKCTVPVSMI